MWNQYIIKTYTAERIYAVKKLKDNSYVLGLFYPNFKLYKK